MAVYAPDTDENRGDYEDIAEFRDQLQEHWEKIVAMRTALAGEGHAMAFLDVLEFQLAAQASAASAAKEDVLPTKLLAVANRLVEIGGEPLARRSSRRGPLSAPPTKGKAT